MKYINPRIKPIYPLYQLNDKLFRIGAQLGITVEFEDPEGQLWSLASKLTGQPIDNVVAEMKTEFPEINEEDIEYGLNILDKQGVIEEALPEKSTKERYVPNIDYFSRFINSGGNRFSIQEKINNSSILLLGLGGGGSNILTLLAGLGPKKITIVDYDRVELGNLGRQFLYRETDIGKLKTAVAKKAINEMNSDIEIEVHNQKITSPNDVLQYTNGIDLVICAIDEPPFLSHRIVNKAIVKANIPCVFGASQVSRGRVYTVIPGVTGCFDCLNLNFSKHDPKFIEQFVGFRNINFNPPSIAYGPGIFQLTAEIVDEAVRVLTGYAPARSLGTQFEINYEDGSSFTHTTWPRFPKECPTCGNGNEKDWEIFNYYKNKEISYD
ncbi:heme biosynthesis protein HemY [Lentilactobacillus fungorum]|uniref:Heme biosynthesis protein HemY n=1 Tax=Lentilactobacillus fungorum TaxID=2201250 RepID=A0ABQ3VXI0_9LACO|nr:ThiF family adenylyltransferase [Lentilactobacillus fungorum]GHP13615.1 heme biosynthesis protein HemY [Lentilactobacillus fungorum]